MRIYTARLQTFFLVQYRPQVVTLDSVWNPISVCWKNTKSLHIVQDFQGHWLVRIFDYIISDEVKVYPVVYRAKRGIKRYMTSVLLCIFTGRRVTVNREHRLHSYYLWYQHVVVVTCRSAVCDAEHSLKSVISISKHLTLEWWLLAGGNPCCLSSLQARKMTELLSDMYSTASSQWARSHYTWLLLSFLAIYPNYTGLWSTWTWWTCMVCITKPLYTDASKQTERAASGVRECNFKSGRAQQVRRFKTMFQCLDWIGGIKCNWKWKNIFFNNAMIKRYWVLLNQYRHSIQLFIQCRVDILLTYSLSRSMQLVRCL